MRRKIFPIILIFTILLSFVFPFATGAMALPVQRPVTVVDEDGQVLFKETILYTSSYTPPQEKIPAAPSPAPATATTKPQKAGLPSRADTGDVRLVIKTAYELLGKSYAYGASGPNSFDCSGLTKFVYQKVGVNLPHSAASQFQSGIRIAREELAPGDLVFFSYYGSAGINHVGVYVGDGMFIHASTPQTGVIINSLKESYYAHNYRGAVRLIR
ncbi:C40 family peptidase [Desulfallas sp. Bu1-1]|uniref:C40 family peptidase n=1 Tax=Desulfallas sp. Bu1-1 TaxID=2787620 RepID=UPI0018A0E04F|nr:C40 family peptidase [Desulfallas sp. Bu1-1]MBF7082007.1 C40 family peptidase [Desulfallas sp. Bu1-1]